MPKSMWQQCGILCPLLSKRCFYVPFRGHKPILTFLRFLKLPFWHFLPFGHIGHFCHFLHFTGPFRVHTPCGLRFRVRFLPFGPIGANWNPPSPLDFMPMAMPKSGWRTPNPQLRPGRPTTCHCLHKQWPFTPQASL